MNDEGFVQPKIIGYRQLTEADAELMNACKVMERNYLSLLDRIAAEGGTLRWVNLARTNLQLATMCASRAVAKPNGEEA